MFIYTVLLIIFASALFSHAYEYEYAVDDGDVDFQSGYEYGYEYDYEYYDRNFTGPVKLPTKYANRPKLVGGTRQLTCVQIKWKAPSRSSKLGSMCAKVAKFYRRNSRGLLNFKTRNKKVWVPYKGKRNYVNRATRYALRKVPKGGFKAVVTRFGRNHAGKGVAYLSSALTSTACHEIGHLLGLGHSGQYEGRKYSSYGDRKSVMGRYSSAWLAAPQMFALGWLRETEVAIFDPERAPYQLFKLRRFSDVDHDEAETGAVVNVIYRNSGRDLFVAFPGCQKGFGCMAIYLSQNNGKSTQKLAQVGTYFHDSRFTGLEISKVSENEEEGTITVSIKKEILPLM